MTEVVQGEAGIKITFLKLSVGIEHMADLISDITIGLERVWESGELLFKLSRYA